MSTQPFLSISHPKNGDWYLKIISLREEISKIEHEITICNNKDSIQLLKNKISQILEEIEILEDNSEDEDEDNDNPEEDA